MDTRSKARIIADAVDRFIHDHHHDLTPVIETVLREFSADMQQIAHAPEFSYEVTSVEEPLAGLVDDGPESDSEPSLELLSDPTLV